MTTIDFQKCVCFFRFHDIIISFNCAIIVRIREEAMFLFSVED